MVELPRGPRGGLQGRPALRLPARQRAPPAQRAPARPGAHRPPVPGRRDGGGAPAHGRGPPDAGATTAPPCPSSRGRSRSAPALPAAQSLLGRALMGAGRRDDAVKAFAAELARNPNDFDANLYLGLMLKDDGRLDEAHEHLKRAQRLRSRDVAVQYALGALHLAAGRTEEARKALEIVIAEAPDYRQGHVLLATAYYRLKEKEKGDREQAIAETLRAAEQAATGAGTTWPGHARVCPEPRRRERRRARGEADAAWRVLAAARTAGAPAPAGAVASSSLVSRGQAAAARRRPARGSGRALRQGAGPAAGLGGRPPGPGHHPLRPQALRPTRATTCSGSRRRPRGRRGLGPPRADATRGWATTTAALTGADARPRSWGSRHRRCSSPSGWSRRSS